MGLVQLATRVERAWVDPPKSKGRLVGGVLAEQTDEWAEGRRYLGLEVLARSRMRVLPDTESEVVADTFIALSA